MHKSEAESDQYLRSLLDTLVRIKNVIDQDGDTFPLFLSRIESDGGNEDTGENRDDITSAIDLLETNGCSYNILDQVKLSQLKNVLREIIKEMDEEIRFAESLTRADKETNIPKMRQMKMDLEQAIQRLPE